MKMHLVLGSTAALFLAACELEPVDSSPPFGGAELARAESACTAAARADRYRVLGVADSRLIVSRGNVINSAEVILRVSDRGRSREITCIYDLRTRTADLRTGRDWRGRGWG